MSIVEDSLAVILNSLAASARGEAYDEDALHEAAVTCCVAQFMSLGVSFDAAIRNFEEREHTFRFHYSEAEGLSVEVEWLDGNAELDIELGGQRAGYDR